jgi:hypothetical protein
MVITRLWITPVLTGDTFSVSDFERFQVQEATHFSGLSKPCLTSLFIAAIIDRPVKICKVVITPLTGAYSESPARMQSKIQKWIIGLDETAQIDLARATSLRGRGKGPDW